MLKVCKGLQLKAEETSCLLALLEFIVRNAARHDISDSVLEKDLLQMGINIENGNELTKYYSDMQDSLVKAMKEKSLRISEV